MTRCPRTSDTEDPEPCLMTINNLKASLLAGERHLAVFADGEARFRSAVRKLGYILPK